MTRTLVVIPARMQSTRLPDKPLADIAGEPMIAHVWRRAMAAQVGRVVVATDSEDIVAAVRAVGGEAVMTRADHTSGSDRVFEAVNRIDPEIDHDIVLNLQGDLPTLEPHLIRECLAPLAEKGPDITTIAAEIKVEEERTNPNVVKVVGTPVGMPKNRLRALYFTRATAPHGKGPHYHHIGIYGYRRMALERFVSMKPSPLELREKLEQLRALEMGMRIECGVVPDFPKGVDSPPDLEAARKALSPA